MILDCVPQSYGQVLFGYHLATLEEVQEHKHWILNSMDKWAIAKFEDGYVDTYLIALIILANFLFLDIWDRFWKPYLRK